MITQIINLSDFEVIKRYSDRYKINDNYKLKGLLALEIRNINSHIDNKIEKFLISTNKFFYKCKTGNNYSLFIPGWSEDFKELFENTNSVKESPENNIKDTIIKFKEYGSNSYKIGGRTIIFDRPYVMGILNITDNSFSDGGKYLRVEDAVKHALEMLEQGADFIDIGGESTRPGSDGISLDEEINRVLPVIEEVLKRRPDAIISIDTTKCAVADSALKSGAKIVNDISGFNFDPEIIEVVKKYDAAYVLMHMKGRPKEMQVDPYYDDVITEIYDYLFEKIKILENRGVSKIFIDPGIGFGKRVEDNFEILKRLGDFRSIGYPILIGVSRKTFIGKTLDLDVNNRDNATSIVDSIAIKNGARIIRTHNVINGVQVCKLLKQLA